MSGLVASSKQSTSAPQSWLGRSHVTTFVRCLHLLDLDLLEDWPGVTEQLFTSKVAQQNLQQRVKAVEWSLYRLFELYDPAETKDKLRPFFPPTTQLQSLNLRAALYRCLTELKKNGILGKDVVLRKTMLDDCKGERFEEVIANFGMVTLRKVTVLPGKAISDHHALPLILAIRASLQRNLESRKEGDTYLRQELERLGVASQVIQQRLEASESASVKLDKAKQEELRALIDSNWIGNTTWSDILLKGIPVETVLEVEHSSQQSDILSEPRVLIQGLDARIQKHRTRLAEWKIIAKDLTRPQRSPTDHEHLPGARARPETLRFTEHNTLNLSDHQVAVEQKMTMDESYASLLVSMRRDFSATNMSTKKIKAEPTHTLTSEGKPVVDHRISPLNKVTLTTPSHRSSVAEQSSLVRHSITSDHDDESIPSSDEKQRSISSSPPQSSLGDSPWLPNISRSATVPEQNEITPVRIPTPPNTIVSEPPISPSKLWMSLADRTRASMSLTGRASVLTDPDSPVSTNDTQHLPSSSVQDWHQSSDDDRHTTLAERTRKSMSMFSNSSAIRQRKANSLKRNSQAFPVNQFETPSHSRPQVEQASGSGASTPRDQLFDEEAEYTSIFKSRPKIALSPAFGSEQKPSGLGSILEQDMEKLDLDSGDDIG